MKRFGQVVVVIVSATFGLNASSAIAAANAPKAASGETQVIAKLKGRELTLSQLRQEMARLRLSPTDQNAERVAMESLLTRTLLAGAARKANIHRKPEAIAHMYAAQDQALAEIYVASASQPAEPTRDEINTYIAENADLFTARKIYDLSVLTLPSKYFDDETLTPLFDEEPNFDRLAAILEKATATFSILPSVRPSDSFAAPIRHQLQKYDVHDNIVLKGEHQTQILKIMRVRPAPVAGREQPVLARRLLMEAAAGDRVRTLLERLKRDANVQYFRASATPAPAPTKTAAGSPAPSTNTPGKTPTSQSKEQ